MKVPKKPTGRRALPFYWWRRYRSHKCLPYKSRLIDKIQNGDYEATPFFNEAKWELHWMKDEQQDFIDNYQGEDPKHDYLYLEIEVKARKRYNRLYEDGMKDEADRISRLTNNFARNFKVSKDKMQELIEGFDGTVLELYRFMRNDLVT